MRQGRTVVEVAKGCVVAAAVRRVVHGGHAGIPLASHARISGRCSQGQTCRASTSARGLGLLLELQLPERGPGWQSQSPSQSQSQSQSLQNSQS